MRFAFEEHSEKKNNQIHPGLNHRLFKTLPVANQTALVDPVPYHLFLLSHINKIKPLPAPSQEQVLRVNACQACNVCLRSTLEPVIFP